MVLAPVERVYKAWTEPAQISKWFACGATTNVLVSQDFRVGGEYRIECHSPEGTLATIFGIFQEIAPNRKLVYTWNNISAEYPANDTVVSVEFLDRGETTEIVLKHTNFAIPLSAEGHTFGWGGSVDKLAQLCQN